MTSRGRRLLLLAAGLYLVSWGFGTAVMFPVAVGLSIATGNMTAVPNPHETR